MKFTIGLQQTVVTVKRSKELTGNDRTFLVRIFFYFRFIANISNAIVSISSGESKAELGVVNLTIV